MSCIVGPIENLKGIIFSRVCVSVCLCVSDRHFYPSTLTDFDETRWDIVIEPVAQRRAAIEARGHSELGAQLGRKNPPAC